MLGMQIGIQKDKTKASPTPPHLLIRIYLDNQFVWLSKFSNIYLTYEKNGTSRID